MPVTLLSLFSDIPVRVLSGTLDDAPITGIVIDSRQVHPGCLFVALTGGSVDGHDFIPEAVENGAAAIVGEKPLSRQRVPYIQVEDSRQAVPWLAAALHGFPARKMTVIGVTGTDGKTTTCNLIYRILLSAGIKAGLISTVNAVIGDEVLDTGFHVTTPDAPDVQRYLARMAESGLTHVVLETTSHGWAQHRVDACEFDVGVITNITHEHLDQHGSFENYRRAKARLLGSLGQTLPKPQGNPRLAVLNRDDSSYDFLSEFLRSSANDRGSDIRSVSYGIHAAAYVRASEIHYTSQGTSFVVIGDRYQVPLSSRLIGAFNVSNCLAAFSAAVCGLGIDPPIAARGIASLEGVPGRMERIDLGQPFTAIVDFAHTPNAMQVALEALHQMISSNLPGSSEEHAARLGRKGEAPGRARIIVIFGSAGLRDREKRRMLAEVANRMADISILTAEDPRTESLDSILEAMAAGARGQGGEEGRSFYRVPDRREAIRMAIRLAQPGDIVVACGKGHEQSMCFGTTEFPWDDRQAMRAALAEHLGIPGPAMPYLPDPKS